MKIKTAILILIFLISITPIKRLEANLNDLIFRSTTAFCAVVCLYSAKLSLTEPLDKDLPKVGEIAARALGFIVSSGLMAICGYYTYKGIGHISRFDFINKFSNIIKQNFQNTFSPIIAQASKSHIYSGIALIMPLIFLSAILKTLKKNDNDLSATQKIAAQTITISALLITYIYIFKTIMSEKIKIAIKETLQNLKKRRLAKNQLKLNNTKIILTI